MWRAEEANEAAGVFSEVATSSSQTFKLSEEIRNATNDQTDKIGSVVHITESIVHIAQETATGTEEVAASASQLSAGMANYIEKSNELNDISIKLKRELSSFKLS